MLKSLIIQHIVYTIFKTMIAFTELYYLTIPLGLFIIYKLLDRLVRVPRIGGYTERYVLVTGAGTGFGYETVRRLDALGCHVFAGVFLQTDVDTIRSTCSSGVDTVLIDIRRPESVKAAFEYVKSKIPSDKGLWGVVNNAGICGIGDMEWLQLSDYEDHIKTNTFGTVSVTITFMPLVKKACGRVVNTSSISGRVSLPFAAPYAMSKYAVEAYSDALRRCMRPYGVKVLLVEPGAHKTPMTAGLREKVLAVWNRTPQTTKDELGQQSLDTVLSAIDKATMANSDRIDEVPDAYIHALMARYPRARYVVGLDANYFFIPIIAMPEWLSDYILSKLS